MFTLDKVAADRSTTSPTGKGEEMRVSISSELAAEHPGFMDGCVERGHRVEVFETDPGPRAATSTPLPPRALLPASGGRLPDPERRPMA